MRWNRFWGRSSTLINTCSDWSLYFGLYILKMWDIDMRNHRTSVYIHWKTQWRQNSNDNHKEEKFVGVTQIVMALCNNLKLYLSFLCRMRWGLERPWWITQTMPRSKIRNQPISARDRSDSGILTNHWADYCGCLCELSCDWLPTRWVTPEVHRCRPGRGSTWRQRSIC